MPKLQFLINGLTNIGESFNFSLKISPLLALCLQLLWGLPLLDKSQGKDYRLKIAIRSTQHLPYTQQLMKPPSIYLWSWQVLIRSRSLCKYKEAIHDVTLDGFTEDQAISILILTVKFVKSENWQWIANMFLMDSYQYRKCKWLRNEMHGHLPSRGCVVSVPDGLLLRC